MSQHFDHPSPDPPELRAAVHPPGSLPAFLTVEEAADILRIGRTTAYALTREWRRTGGRSGLPVVNVGHKLRVPLHRLEELAGGTVMPVQHPTSEDRDRETPTPVPARTPQDRPLTPASIPSESGRPSSRRRRRPAPAGQASLFGEAS